MEEVISRIIGILVNENLNAKDVIQLLDKTKDTYLKRNWHIASDKLHAKDS